MNTNINNIINMNKYLDYSYYCNNKDNLLCNIKLKRYIKKNNNIVINEFKNKEYIINNINLDNDQKESLAIDEYNTLVLAGAGSGKTLTICAKIKYLIEEKNINENEILCISFTNETVNNLKNKIDYNVDIFTFHKLALSILDDYKYFYSIESNYLEYIVNEIFLSIIKEIDEKSIKYFSNIIVNFINLFKNYNYDYKYFDKLLKRNKSKLLKLIKMIYLIYQEELLSSNYIDFNDIINTASSMIKDKGLKRYYKYIIIDEFQDISENRYKFIKEIRDSCNSKLFAVGDDYQSIYRFSGSNINMITKFKKYFGYSKIIKINYTYRNSYELNLLATNFITKNRYQIKKKMLSNKHNNKPVKIIYYKKNMSIKLKKLLDNLNDKVFILGRNNFDINYIIDDDITFKDNIIYKDKEYRFMTVHKSKGLEEENVILINLTDNKYGFPNKKREELIDLLLPKENYLYEEERRLFYVALTRTKKNIYLFVDKEHPSIFVKEIIRNNKKHIEVLDL